MIKENEDIKLLKDIYYNVSTAIGYYIGGTLAIANFKTDKGLFEIKREKPYNEIDLWVAKKYIKYKSTNCAFFNDALNIIKEFEGDAGVAKELLLKCPSS